MRLLGRHDARALVAFGGPATKTAAQLWADATALCQVLPVGPGEILVLCDDRYHFAVGLVAAWTAGRRVGLPPNVQEGRVAELAEMSHVAGIVHDRDDKTGVDLREVLGTRAASDAPPLELSDDAELVVVYTSGSQGQPTAHPKTARQLLGEAEVLGEALGVGVGEVVATVPAHHIYGLLFSVVAPLMNGGSFCRSTPLHAPTVRACLARARDIGKRPPTLISVPAHLRVLAEDGEPLSAAVEVVSSGAPLPEETGARLQAAGARVREVLGSTETGGIAVRAVGETPPAAFSPLPRVRVQVGSDGRLLLDSPFLATSLARPHAVADRIELAADGTFVHKGRADDVVKVGSKRVSLGDLEARLGSLKGVRAARCIAQPTETARGIELAAIVVAPGWSSESLRGAMREFFDPVVIPRRFVFVPEMPVDDRGKTPRAALLACLAFRRDENRAPEFEVLGENGEGDELRVRLRAQLDFAGFAGHFPGFAIVPGVVQVGMASRRALATWADLGGLQSVRKLKFKRPIFPGDEFELTLHRKGPRVEFRFEQPEGLASGATLVFGGEA